MDQQGTSRTVMPAVAAVVVAAGRGIRAGGELPKQYRTIAGAPAIRRTLALFAAHPEVAMVQPVIHPDDSLHFARAAEGLEHLRPVHGGATRQASVLAGLEALTQAGPEIVLIHDAARPFASPKLVARAIAAAAQSGAAIPALPLTDTIKAVDAENRVIETVDRNRLRIIQTPQAFAFSPLLAAHRRAAAEGLASFTDDAAIAEWAGLRVAVFEGERDNIKLTTPEDFLSAGTREVMELADVRTGTGFDVHAFCEGDHVMIGGVRIAHHQGLLGHSDADVALHALTDAILGAIADGDIGVHFPPSDPQWRGASSERFLAFAVERVHARRGMIAHLDLTIVCEAPRIGPHRDAIRARVAGIAGLKADRVGLKATTSEKLGFTGRGEGIAAMATATVRLPWNHHER
jgi:2-C-methyl-D-erythritol 4-phosphate cytidylyltransferase/2-C-methyl-D-erythritol 2,4-cyclodiphosphate synthase